MKGKVRSEQRNKNERKKKLNNGKRNEKIKK